MDTQHSLQRIQDEARIKDISKEDDVSFLKLFRFADKTDYVLMILGSIASLGAGCTGPLILFLLTEFNASYHSNDIDIKKQTGLNTMLGFIYLGLGGLACGWATTTLWLITGERQSAKCRQVYYEALLRQQIGFFDCNQELQMNSKFSMDTKNYQGAIGQKTALSIQILGTFICSIILSFINGWLMTIVIMAAVPLLIFAVYFNLISYETKEKNFLNAYSKAGGQAEEAIASIKTVKQFNAENFHANNYINEIKDTSAKKLGSIIRISLSFGLLNGSIFWIYSLGLWFGANCVMGSNHCPINVSGKYYTLQNAEIIFFTLVMTCFALSGFSPALKKIAIGKQAAKRIFKVLDREPIIKLYENGLKIDDIKGIIQFRNVTFSYPKEKDKKILNNISMIFNVRSIALVGESGCGKSTIAQLLMRFYDPDQGQILLDSHNLKSLDLKWLRSKIGYVGQEPVLFGTTIRENLLYANPQATDEQISEVLKQAEVYEFISKNLQYKFETFVGIGGSQMSGGQKQRIAIARALIKRPKILILDEATSALDRVNQKLIQTTLNKISEKLITITIAHRMGTIINSEMVFVLGDGRIKQNGRFNQLQFFKRNRVITERQDINQQSSKQRQDFEQNEHKKFETIQKIQQKQQVLQSIKRNQELVSHYQKGMKLRILSYCKNRRINLVIAIILSIGIGLIYPIFSIYVGSIITAIFTLQNNHTDKDSIDKVNESSLAFLFIGIIGFLIYCIQMLLGYSAGDQIVENIRQEMFIKILKMPMKWFDRRENTSGALSYCLGYSCEVINELVTTYFFIIIQVLSTTISGFTIAFVYQWRITLVALALFPLIVLSGIMRTHFKNGLSKKVDEAHKLTNGIIVESLINIRTVYAFNMECILVKKHEKSLVKPYEQLVKIGVYSGFMNGLGLISMNTIFGLLLYLGVIFMINFGVELIDLITAIFTCIFTGFQIGNKLNFMPDVGDAKISAANIFNILDSEDEQQIQLRENSQMLMNGFQCNVIFEDVSFKYQNRQQLILKKINFSLKEGEKIAFVGPSGCGKSTIMQLLMRFYDPSSGRILINNINIKDFDIKYLRRQFGVVSQEPTVFNASFRQNIRYNNLQASEEDIREAARKANALEFIQGKEKLQKQLNQHDQLHDNENGQGFDRMVGLKGLHISGGQKQRVAIARAILRSPKILLLDEATSALDAENERIVQESIDQIMKDKTTVTVAHKIQTIQNSDVINVINKGVIVEHGTYEQLVSMHGVFYQLERGQKI